MKLLSLSVEHFRCVRKASVEFGPGLNVLHGPNDLGKSSLAAAIRAVLLLQASSREHEEFVNWSGSGVPHVELVFESEPQRIWRVRKTFGSAAQAYLDESRDGVDFQLETRGRDVDGRLSEILQWGLAPPGGRGRPKGMPMTFLSTALLAEQDRVAAIFDQALSKDSDESGRDRLVQALKAVAEDPLYKSVLERVQSRFDEAFTSNGGKRRGKNSPWTQISEMIRQKQDNERHWKEHLQKTDAIELELQSLHSRQMERREAVETAVGIVERMENDYRAGQQRAQVLARLQQAEARLAGITAAFAELAQAEARRCALVVQVEDLGKRAEAARTAAAKAARQLQSAREEAARLESSDRANELLLKRASLEKRQAELQAEQLRNRGGLERIRTVQTVDKESRDLAGTVNSLQQTRAQLDESLEAARQREASLRSIASLIRCRNARDALQKAAAGLAQVTAWRDEAGRIRAAASALESSLSAVPLPSAALLADFRQLDQQLQLGRARLDVGLHIRIQPKRSLSVNLARDGEDPVPYDLNGGTLETSAASEVLIDIEQVAEIAVTGGAQTAREEVARLRNRWLAEVEPALERANAVTLDHLGRMVADVAQRSQEIHEARRSAAQLEQRAADQPDWATQKALRQQELAAAEAALGAADRAAAEALSRKLRITDLAAAEAQLEKLRPEKDQLLEAKQKLDADLAAANALCVEKQAALATAKSGIGDDWHALVPRLEERQAAIDSEAAAIQGQLAGLTTETGKALKAAKKAVATAEQTCAADDAASTQAAEELLAAQRRQASAEGEIQARREAAAKLDEAAARAAVEQVQVELGQVPELPQAVSKESLEEARARLQAARDDLRRIEDDIHARRGALQHVGGEVARQKAAAAQEALKAALAKEHFLQTDYAAWDLLRNTLLDAEREESVHLGRTLGDPIARRFAELTDRRYAGLSLGPDLETTAISAAGDARPVSALSVGTRDQLSTIFRLTLAEQLRSAVMLDDQLTQSDGDRMQWLRDLIRQLAANIQILVFTCRPADYLLPGEMKTSRKSPVRSIPLAQIIERADAANSNTA